MSKLSKGLNFGSNLSMGRRSCDVDFVYLHEIAGSNSGLSAKHKYRSRKQVNGNGNKKGCE